MKVWIETERLIIRDPIIEDYESYYAMRCDAEVSRYTGGITRLSQEAIYERMLRRTQDHSDKPKEYSVVLKATNEYLGYCGFQYCEVLQDIEILYGYAKKYWGQGYAKEAAMAVLKFGLDDLGLEKVVAAVNLENIASDKVLSGIGMAYTEDIAWPGQGMVKKYEITRDKTTYS